MTDRLLQPMERKLKDYAVLALKGMGMGAADGNHCVYCWHLR